MSPEARSDTQRFQDLLVGGCGASSTWMITLSPGYSESGNARYCA